MVSLSEDESRQAGTFRVRIPVRVYELDVQGHVNGAIYLQYSEHSRWECLRAAGVGQRALHARGVSPVRLEETLRYHRELRAGDEVTVSCGFVWDEGRTFQVRHEFRLDDGTLVAEVTGVGGMLDLRTRRLVADPGKHFRALATAPELLGL
ncbi:acyl-CoA thioesterase [Gandjariella thermophila]|nr:acyl-CoA thioesterase [Gandjariella thermophila]